ncbi:MAG: polyprenol monophosphomannose synthase [Propioniciclava sp.]
MFPEGPPSLGRVLVIIPTYNEIDNIDMIVGRLRAATPHVEVLVVDDNSPDGTGVRADELAATDDQVHVLHREGKEGLGAAYLAGFGWGLERGYDVLVEFDADGSHQPEELPRVLAALERADMVKGSRWVRGGSVINWPRSREFLSRGGSLYTRMMLGLPIKDITGGLNAFRAPILQAALAHPIDQHGYGIQRDLTWHVYSNGGRIVEVPIEFREREHGDSKMDGAVVVEAMRSTTRLGLQHRGRQLRALAGRARAGADTVGRTAGRLAGSVWTAGTRAAQRRRGGD